MFNLDEDDVRNNSTVILGFDDKESNVKQGTGQIKTFNQLGLKGDDKNKKPDGWYLPDDKTKVAIIFEAKSTKEDVYNPAWIEEITRNVRIAAQKYKRIVGILYNGKEQYVIKYDGTTMNTSDDIVKVEDVSKDLQHKSYYLALFNENKIDKQKIYDLTKKINDCLHFKFGIKNLYHRMIFTACALVAKRFDAKLVKDQSYLGMKYEIEATLQKQETESKAEKEKIDFLLEVYREIKMNNPDNQEAINDFIDWISQISDCVNSDYWNGEDVMGIFFNEFSRYKAKSDAGQVFTPDHITSFMYRLIDVNMHDKVLDATCGSGAFLVKAMCNMIKESGGVNSNAYKSITKKQLYGIEFDREIFALACANMLIHKDGKTNIEHMDTRTAEACEWMQTKAITKVLMNPPYEHKYGCIDIVQNVLDSVAFDPQNPDVPRHIQCAFILPDKKLEKDGKNKRYGNKLLEKHCLKTIIKLPENLFFRVGVTTSIFVFESGTPQNGQNIIGYYVEDDGLETVKNQGRQDIKDKWQDFEDYWVKAIHDGVDDRFDTRQVIDPREHLSYQMPQKPFEVFEEDFIKTLTDYEMYHRGIDPKQFNEAILSNVLYNSEVTQEDDTLNIKISV